MKKILFIAALIFSLCVLAVNAEAQCSICTRTASQLGEKPARGLNAGIIYLAATPLAVVGIIGFRWWRNNRKAEA
jgi:hypothetical protein